MKDIRPTVAKNLSALRREKGLTQAELAEKMNYSDKAVSRWENGDALPDLNKLYELCEFYGITLNDLVDENCRIDESRERARESLIYRIFLCAIWGAVVWLIATIFFVYTLSIKNEVIWTIFIWAIPASAAAVLVVGRGLFKSIAVFIMTSFIMWTALLAVYLHLLAYNLWMVFLIGIPLELILFLRYKLKQFR